jgi:hypothetical protein
VAKVWKSVGAVRVYSPAKAAAVAFVAVAAVGGGGVAAGLALAGEDSGPSDPGRTVTRTVTEPGPDAAPTTHVSESSGDPKRAYARGYRAGARAVFGESSFRAGRAYIVRLTSGGDGVPYRIDQSHPVVAGESYYLCSGGTRLCIAGG